MSDTVAEPNPAAVTGNPSLHPDTNKNIGSMADAFKKAMSNEPKPEPASEPTPAAEPASVELDEGDARESRSAKDFKLIKQERDEAKARVAELLSQVSDYEANTAVADELEKLRSEYDEISKTLSQTNLERHPKFREQFVKPLETQIDRAKAYVPEGDRAALDKILRMPVGESRANALDDLVGDLPASRQAYLQGIVNRIDEISYERDQRLAESKASYEKLVQEESLLSEQKSADRNKALEKSFSTMLKEAQESIPIYQLREGDEEWNTGVRERVNLAKKILLEQNTFEDAATAALWAASGGALVEQNAALVEHNRRLNAELSKLKGAEPSAAGSSADTKSRSKSSNSFSDRVLGELRQMGIRGA